MTNGRYRIAKSAKIAPNRLLQVSNASHNFAFASHNSLICRTIGERRPQQDGYSLELPVITILSLLWFLK